MTSLANHIELRAPACPVAEAPGRDADLLAIYDYQDAVERASTCPVCGVPYDEPRKPHHWDRRYIQVITGNDTWDTYACPGCCPEQYVARAEVYGDRPYNTQRVLDRAARDVAAGRRL